MSKSGSKKAQEKGIIKGSILFVHITGEMLPKNCTQAKIHSSSALCHDTVDYLYRTRDITMLMLLSLFRKSGVDGNADKTVKRNTGGEMYKMKHISTYRNPNSL